MLWGEWVESGGAAGAEPPDYAKQLIDDIGAFQSALICHRNALRNFVEFQIQSYFYHRTCRYRAAQRHFDE